MLRLLGELIKLFWGGIKRLFINPDRPQRDVRRNRYVESAFLTTEEVAERDAKKTGQEEK